MSYTDFRGNEVKVGSKIFYAITKNRSACLVEAEVLEIRPRKEGERGPAFKLHVQPLRDSYGQRWSNVKGFDSERREFITEGLPKAVTLQHTDRFAVIA
jgi:hypothetical protein